MMHLEFGGARIPVPAGETLIGSAPGCAIVLEGEGVQPRHAILLGTAQGAAAIRAGEPGAELLVNGVRLGADPTPVLHGDKIQIGPHEILAVDSRRVGHTRQPEGGTCAHDRRHLGGLELELLAVGRGHVRGEPSPHGLRRKHADQGR